MSDNEDGAEPGVTPPTSKKFDSVLRAYQETMRQFLALQERVMMGYLRNPAPRKVKPLAEPEAPPPLQTSAEGPADEAVTARPPAGGRPQPAVIPESPPEASPNPQRAEPDPQPATGVEPEPAPAPEQRPEPSACSPNNADCRALLLEVVSDRTGYPPEMIDLDQDIEGDLGIDSIKRVEILAMLRKSLPEDTQALIKERMDEVSKARTFQSILEWLEKTAC